jgi:hypothetical protein
MEVSVGRSVDHEKGRRKMRDDAGGKRCSVQRFFSTFAD